MGKDRFEINSTFIVERPNSIILLCFTTLEVVWLHKQPQFNSVQNYFENYSTQFNGD
jgi:hypothetical protein